MSTKKKLREHFANPLLTPQYQQRAARILREHFLKYGSEICPEKSGRWVELEFRENRRWKTSQNGPFRSVRKALEHAEMIGCRKIRIVPTVGSGDYMKLKRSVARAQSDMLRNHRTRIEKRTAKLIFPPPDPKTIRALKKRAASTFSERTAMRIDKVVASMTGFKGPDITSGPLIYVEPSLEQVRLAKRIVSSSGSARRQVKKLIDVSEKALKLARQL